MNRMIPTIGLAVLALTAPTLGAQAHSDETRRKAPSCASAPTGSSDCVAVPKRPKKVYAAGYDIVPERYLNGSRFPPFDLFRPVR